jgi:drug/metabolite transporter (DMT)-like permease
MLKLGSNKLTGQLPEELCNLNQTTSIDLSNNFHSGTIPDRWSSLTNLEQLLLGSNQLNGTLPQNFTSLAKLTEFDMGSNNLHGINLSEFVTPLLMKEAKCLIFNSPHSCTMMRVLHLSNCSLGGTFPQMMMLATEAYSIDVSHNNLVGTLPDAYGEIYFDKFVNNYHRFVIVPPSWSTFSIQNNSGITGRIPGAWGRMNKGKGAWVMDFRGTKMRANRSSMYKNVSDLLPRYKGDASSWLSFSDEVLSRKIQNPIADGSLLPNPIDCRRIVGVDNANAEVRLDADYMQYLDCNCSKGFFGNPPYCVKCPLAQSSTPVKCEVGPDSQSGDALLKQYPIVQAYIPRGYWTAPVNITCAANPNDVHCTHSWEDATPCLPGYCCLPNSSSDSQCQVITFQCGNLSNCAYDDGFGNLSNFVKTDPTSMCGKSFRNASTLLCSECITNYSATFSSTKCVPDCTKWGAMQYVYLLGLFCCSFAVVLVLVNMPLDPASRGVFVVTGYFFQTVGIVSFRSSDSSLALPYIVAGLFELNLSPAQGICVIPNLTDLTKLYFDWVSPFILIFSFLVFQKIETSRIFLRALGSFSSCFVSLVRCCFPAERDPEEDGTAYREDGSLNRITEEDGLLGGSIDIGKGAGARNGNTCNIHETQLLQHESAEDANAWRTKHGGGQSTEDKAFLEWQKNQYKYGVGAAGAPASARKSFSSVGHVPVDASVLRTTADPSRGDIIKGTSPGVTIKGSSPRGGKSKRLAAGSFTPRQLSQLSLRRNANGDFLSADSERMSGRESRIFQSEYSFSRSSTASRSEVSFGGSGNQRKKYGSHGSSGSGTQTLTDMRKLDQVAMTIVILFLLCYSSFLRTTMELLDCVEIQACNKPSCFRLFAAAEYTACYSNNQKMLIAYLSIVLVPFPFITEWYRRRLNRRKRSNNTSSNAIEADTDGVDSEDASSTFNSEVGSEAESETESEAEDTGGRGRGCAADFEDDAAELRSIDAAELLSTSQTIERREGDGTGETGKKAAKHLAFERAYLNIFQKPFKPEYSFWQSVTMFRRLVVISVHTFSRNNPLLRWLLLDVVCMLILMSHIWCYPFKRDLDNFFELISLFSLTMLSLMSTYHHALGIQTAVGGRIAVDIVLIESLTMLSVTVALMAYVIYNWTLKRRKLLAQVNRFFETRSTNLANGSIVCFVLLVGSQFSLVKRAEDKHCFPPAMLCAIRYGSASILLGLMPIGSCALWMPKLYKSIKAKYFNRRALTTIFLMAFFNCTGPQLCIALAETYADSGLISLFSSITPLFTAVIGLLLHYLYPSSAAVIQPPPMTWQSCLFFLTAFAGVALVLFSGPKGKAASHDSTKIVVYSLIGLLASVSYACGLLFSKLYGGSLMKGAGAWHMYTLVAMQSFAAAGQSLVASLLTEFNHPPLATTGPQSERFRRHFSLGSPSEALTDPECFADVSLGLSGITIVTFMLYFYVISTLGPLRMSYAFYFIPVVGIVESAITHPENWDFPGHHLALHVLGVVFGAMMVLGSVLGLNPSRPPPAPTPSPGQRKERSAGMAESLLSKDGAA